MSILLDKIKTLSLTFLPQITPLSAESVVVLLFGQQLLANTKNWLDTAEDPADRISQEDALEIEDIVSNTYYELMRPLLGVPFAYITALPPSGTLPCDGTTHNRVDYPELYAVLDPAFIVDEDTFITPDLRGLTIIGAAYPPTGETTDNLIISQQEDNCYMYEGDVVTVGNLYMGRNASSGMGLRFQSPTVEPETVLTSATLIIRPFDDNENTPFTIDVYGIEEANPGIWTDVNQPYPRSYVPTVSSYLPPSWTPGVDLEIDVTDTVQEIINQVGYSLGNPIALSCFNEDEISGYLAVVGFDEDEVNCARLRLVWGGGSGGEFAVNDTGGEQTHILTVEELAEHTHTDAGHTHSYSSLDIPVLVVSPGEVSTPTFDLFPSSTGTGFADISDTGENEPHNNMQPYRALRYCVAAL